ncbi:MAG: hypothetical protein IIW69_00450 [Bacteroidaceae bacterium]|nr:hypothetical protein [Bacteroidaceae bacterium]
MNVGTLKVLLENIPDDAEGYVWADHGQRIEMAGYFDTTHQDDLDYSYEDGELVTDNYINEEYNGNHHDVTEEYGVEFADEITAVIISA